jgi:hypothetical protein
MEKQLLLPRIPIGHLTIDEFDELAEAIKRITGHTIYLAVKESPIDIQPKLIKNKEEKK